MFGDEGGASGVSGGASAEASLNTGASESRVEYGLDPNEGAAAEGQNGTDEGGASTPEDLDEEFNELIRGKYKKQFGARMQEGIQNRFKNSQNYEVQVGQYQEAVAPLLAMYGLKADDINGLKNAIANDDGLISGFADDNGMTSDKAREYLKQKWDAQLGNEFRARIEEEQQKQEQFNEWNEQAAELSESVPNFDFDAEMQNDNFVDFLAKGNSVKDAFILTHFAELMMQSNSQSQENATRNVVEQLNQRAVRPVEGASNPQPAVVRKTDPSKFTKEDMMEIRNRVLSGETIRF